MANNKKRAGVYKKSRIKTSDFLPGVFQTNLNKRWLDSTLDQMVSKSDLRWVEGYFGKRSGKYAEGQDEYIQPPVNTTARNRSQLSPAIVTKKADGSIDNAMTFDDVIAAVNTNFSDYNYNSAYASAIYGYHPPIDSDKFVNYSNYYWVEELPVYEAEKYTGDITNPVAESLRREIYTLTDDNNSFRVDNNMLIKFVGTNWDSAIQANTYIVTGVGDNIRFLLYRDGLGKRYYTSSNKGDVKFAGFWDHSNYYTVTPNTSSEYWIDNRTPQEILDAYNNDNSASKLPIFDGFNFSNIGSNPSMFTAGVLIKFGGDWEIDDLERSKIYYTEIDQNTGNPTLRVIIDAEYDISGNISTGLGFISLPEDQPLLDLLEGWDKDYWDSAVNQIVLKDYHVIAKHDGYQTAWSRNNNWVSVNTIHKLRDLMGDSFSVNDYINQERIAKRPIIEFNKNMALWNFGDDFPQLDTWVGIVDFILDPADAQHTVQDDGAGNLSYPDPTDLPVPVGSRVIFSIPELDGEAYRKVFQLESDGTLTSVVELGENRSVFINSTVHESLAQWNDSDAFFDGTTWSLGQQKTKVNQPPLFRLYDYAGRTLEDYAGSSFAGSKVFGYRIGTGNVDTELGLRLSYRDSVKGAEFEFENYIITKKYTESFTSSIDEKISHYQTIPGYYFFKIDGFLSYVYKKNEVGAGTRQEHVYEITDVSEDLTIPFGYDDWRFRKEVLFHAYDSRPLMSEIVGNGIYLDKQRTIIAGDNQTLIFHNLIPDADVVFTTADGVDIESGLYSGDIIINRSGIEIEIEINNSANEIIYVNTNPKVFGTQVDARILIFAADSLYHSVFVNGKPLSLTDYQINNDSIVIDKNLLAIGDLVDFEYYNNSPQTDANTSLPDSMDTNPNNQLMETFTLSETLGHWSSVISSQPGFQGEAYGYNNYNEIVKLPNIGGTIHLHADTSIMHDLAYSNAALDVTGALIEQGADWDGFTERFKNQVRRLYATKTYSTVFDIVADALEAVTLNRKGSVLYRDSNMVYGHRHNLETIEVTAGTSIYYSKYTVNGDDNIRDHVYLYLTDDRDSDGNFIQRLLTKDVDYTIYGNRIDLIVNPIANTLTQKRPFLTLSYHHMDEESFVPPSPVKLKMQNAYLPQVVDDVLYTHDGRQIKLAPGAELENPSAENFDPVNAAVFDLEKRIYSGLVSVDRLYGDRYDAVVNNYANVYAWLPAQHHETWYSLEQVNDYTEKFYQKWARERNIQTLNPENYYDPADPFTWNYSSIEIGKHFTGNQLPGHWVGAYTVLFGTSTPHLTPWHMLGYTFKPTWWDSYYSWTDTAKRQALLTDLKYGVVDRQLNPPEIRYQESLYARYYWDWGNNCPVDTNGDLLPPNQVLGTASAVNAAKPFEFGDWGPVEQQWRSSAQGYMALVDAVVKLNPGRAWSEFFQPGSSFKNKYTTNDLNLYTKQLPTVAQYPVPGKIYDSLVRSVYFKNDVDRFPSLSNATSMRIADGDGTLEAKTKISYVASGSYDLDGQKYNKISAVSVVSRGRGYTSPPAVLTTFTAAQNQSSEIEINLDQVAYVASGISQAQYNYGLRRQLAIDLDQTYSTLTTQLAQKVGGFTSKHLVSMYADSSIQGAFRLSESDYHLGMYQGYPVEIVTASQVTVTKTETGYVVSGVSSQRQEFEFYEPDMTNISGVANVGIGNVSVRKYKRFAGVPSTIQYGAKLAKIQDTYNFIRGYWHWMELSGYQLTEDGDAQAVRFVQWAIGADDDESITLKLGNEIQFTPVFGSVYEYNRFQYHRNDILDSQGDVVSNEDISVNRLEGTVNVKTKDGSDIGSIASAVVLYEHIVILNNDSSLGVKFYDPAKDVRYHRLYAAGRITDDWRGEKNALGYLVFDDRIVQNFDSSVSAVDDYYRTDVSEFNPALTKTKDLTIGNIDREWLANLGLNKNTITNFYQGAIKEAGTRGAIEKIARTSVLDHGTTTIDVSEQFMFNQSYFGENKLDNHIEVQLTSSDINNRPQIIKFADLDQGESSDNILSYASGNKKIVHIGDPTFETIAFEKSSLELLTAGEALTTEVDYQTLTMETLPSVFDQSADYANIPTWQSDISYKLGDLVRYEGKLFKCLVNATGLLVVEEGVDATGTVTNPVFPNGTVVDIAGISTVLENFTTVYDNITALGTAVSPEIDPEETLVIDGVSVGFNKTTTVTVVIGDAVLRGDISNPAIPDATGQSITINGVLIDFNEDTPADQTESFVGANVGSTPANVVENFVGVDITPADQTETFVASASQTDFTVTLETLGSDWSVAEVSVDGTPTVDYTVLGQVVTVNSPVMAGGESVEITIQHVTVLEDTFVISQVLTPTGYAVSTVAVNGSPTTDFVLSGQTLTFNTPPAAGAGIQVTLVHDTVIDLQDTFVISQTLDVWSVTQVSVDGTVKTIGSDYNIVGQNLVFTPSNEPAIGEIIVATLSHIPASLDLAEIVDKINSKFDQFAVEKVTASVSTDGFSRLVISFTTFNPNALLELAASTTNTLLGFRESGQVARPPSEIRVVNDTLTLDEIVSQINQTSTTNVTAGILANQILLTSTNTTLTLSGTAVAILGLENFYSATTSTVPTFSSMILAVQTINSSLLDNGVTTVTATIDNNRIKISSTENVLDLGDTDFNTIAGLPSGELVSLVEEVENEFKYTEWQDISNEDPALFSVWVADDSLYEVNEIDNVQTKFYSWNVFQAQNERAMFTLSTDGTDCGICAGNATRDGNDAEVTTNISHNLQVGDYVMLLNTTTTPNIDGIHRVTKLGAGSNGHRIFYIDRFIDECGNAAAVIPMRTQRFNTVEELDSAISNPNWSFPDGSYVWTNYDNTLTRSTNVYKINGNNPPLLERTTIQRVTNADIQNAVIYDANINQTVAEFEVFDPIRGIIPGVADRELDFKTAFDPATYNVSTDDYYTTDENDAWADQQVGQRWWNIGKARYYDYDQGPLAYRAANWGRQFAGSEIEVWEWTKSSIPPDEYEKIVQNGAEIEMFGTLATGMPYGVFDVQANETLYYYTQLEEWDAGQGKYRNVYYFWVKDKTTTANPDHMLTAKSMADIIDNPTANGIGWVAAISENAVIVSNINYYLTDDSTVLQINKRNSGHAHNNWMLIAQDRDQIPEYWYIGVRNNLAGIDANDEKIPDFGLHPLNRYGDDRSIKQAWFDDIRDARYNVTLMINELLQDVNIAEDLKSTWNTTISQLGENGKLVLPRRMWKWADFISQDYNEYLQPTLDILSTLDLDDINTDLHQAVALEIIDPETELDRSEVYYYIDGVWQLVRKNNSTIEFDPLQLSLTHGWDTSPWDMISWDNTNISEYWRVIIDACRYDLFTGPRLRKFNHLFFGIVEYVLSKMQQTNWVHKSTYIAMYVTSQVETRNRRYKRNQINEILGYVNTVKPFHTKVSNIYDIYEADDAVDLAIEYTEQKKITVDISPRAQNFVGTIIDSSALTKVLEYTATGSLEYRIATRVAVLGENNWQVAQISVGSTVLTESVDYVVLGQVITFEVAPTESVTIELEPWSEIVVSGGSFTEDDTQYTVIYDNGALHQPYNYTNSNGVINEYQGTTLDLRPLELLNILVQTNTDGNVVDSDTRTFVYIQDNNENVGVYGLAAVNTTSLAANFEHDDVTAIVTNGSVFALNGFAYIDGEVVKFDRSGNTLYIRQRGVNGTFAIQHLAGGRVVDVTNTAISTVTDKFRVQPRFNQPGLGILDSDDAIAPNELAAAGQGITI